MGRPKRYLVCSCGEPATCGQYRRKGDPLCNRCYQRTRSADVGAAGRYSRNAAVVLKTGKPCTDCGGTFHIAAMEWDHVPERGPKLFNIGAGDYSLAKTLTEIAKCDLVCANCHRVRTWDRHRGQEVAPAED